MMEQIWARSTRISMENNGLYGADIHRRNLVLLEGIREYVNIQDKTVLNDCLIFVVAFCLYKTKEEKSNPSLLYLITPKCLEQCFVPNLLYASGPSGGSLAAILHWRKILTSSGVKLPVTV